MAEREDLFLKILQDNYPDLYQMALQKKYKILVPQKRCIIETMLNRNFYDNHIFNVSRFDDSMYVNLNGKVLKLDNQKFTSYLGWKKDMEFSIKDQFVVDQDLSCILIDNVCDDSNYNKTTSSSQSSTKIPLKRFSTMKEYIEYYNTKAFDFNEFKEAYDMLEYKTDFLRNNIIFMRNHEEDYSVYFNTEIRDIQDSFKNALSKIKSNISSLDILVAELVDSLVFDKMYDFIFNSLIDFHKEEENEIKNKMKEYPGKYDLANQQVDKAYRDCKFEKAVALLKEMSEKKNVFEKLLLLTEINNKIAEEAKEAYERDAVKNFYNPESDVLLHFWTYVISKSNIQNIMAESTFLKLFNFIGYAYGEASYLAITFITAADSILRDFVKEDPYKTSLAQNIIPSIISTTKVDSYGKKYQDRTMSVSNKKSMKI